MSGKGIEAVVDAYNITGAPVVSLKVDDRRISNPTLRTTSHGITVSGTVEAVADSHTVEICLTFPEVNLGEAHVTFSGFATLTRALTSIGGQGSLPGRCTNTSYGLLPVRHPVRRAEFSDGCSTTG